MYKHLYRRFLEAHAKELHFACHSHHYWPDVTRDAHLQYWDDSCRYVDDKWTHFFSTKIPQAQKRISEVLNVTSPSQIVFAPNTHEFVFRLLSALDWSQKIRILTTDSEFYSFDRQVNRLAEMAHFEVIKVPTLPFDTFHERFESEMAKGSWDFIFISHVFFNSGLACDIKRLVKCAPSEPLFVVDGYHSFMAMPLDFAEIQDRAFYLAGSYKYAQGGEGACFLYVPPSTRHRPFYTGWFAELSHLATVDSQVGYPEDSMQYAGSTMDFSALYRLIAVLDKFQEEGLSLFKIHDFIQKNQDLFSSLMDSSQHPLLNRQNLILEDEKNHGHFFTFKLPSTEVTKNIVKSLDSKGVKTDSRGDRLRFGFGLYHDASSIHSLWNVLKTDS